MRQIRVNSRPFFLFSNLAPLPASLRNPQNTRPGISGNQRNQRTFFNYSASTQKIPIQKRWLMCRSWGLCSPFGVLGDKPWPPGGHRNCARDWRGAERPRKRRNPRKARFFAEQKMRPDFYDFCDVHAGVLVAGFLIGYTEALWKIILKAVRC
jgi:hypothetical protein